MLFKVEDEMTLKEFLEKSGFSKKFIRSHYLNHIFVNGLKRNLYESVFKEDKIEVVLNETTQINKISHPLNILYEDSEFLIVYKEKNLPMIGTKKHYELHLSGIVLNYYGEKAIESTIHFVNRLDKDTEGIVIIAKNGYIHSLMCEIKIKKKYLCLVEGHLNVKGMSIFKIQKNDITGKREICPDGKECFTFYETRAFQGENTLMEVDLITGRTHQIRVCFENLNHPLIGDVIYNDKKYQSNELFYLKNYYIRFNHPLEDKIIEIEV